VRFKYIRNRIRFFKLKNKEPYLSLFKILDFYPDDINLYEQAFMHRSIAISQLRNSNNERLEFLGDAVLNTIISDIVFNYFADKREGFLTNTRSKIVQRETLNQVALELGIDRMVSSMPYASSHNKYMYGNALEALIGAVYLDKGYRVCRRFVEERIVNRFISLDKLANREVNFKSRLLEWGQKAKMAIEFDLIKTYIDDLGHPVFQTVVTLEGKPLGRGTGSTKKESQQLAAKTVLNKIRKDKDVKRLVENLTPIETS
jgi:ribonuclease-3